MPRPSNWHSPTTAIRIPAHAVPLALALAKKLDTPESSVQNPYLITVGEDRYFLSPPELSPKESAEMDQQVDQVVKDLEPLLGENTVPWLIATLTPHCLDPL